MIIFFDDSITYTFAPEETSEEPTTSEGFIGISAEGSYREILSHIDMTCTLLLITVFFFNCLFLFRGFLKNLH